jgi:hypothetical protein
MNSMIQRIAMTCALALVLACSVAVAVAAEPAGQPPVVGTWQGVLPNGMGGQIRVVLHVTQSADGALGATMDSPDQGATAIPVAKVTFAEQKLGLDVTAVGGSYLGTFDPAKKEIAGTWKQSGQEIPLVLKQDAPAK